MSKNPQDRNRMPGQSKDDEEMEKMPKDAKRMDPKKGQHGGQGQQGQQGQHGQGGQQSWNPGHKDEQSGQPQKRDQMNRPKDTTEETDDRKKRPA